MIISAICQLSYFLYKTEFSLNWKIWRWKLMRLYTLWYCATQFLIKLKIIFNLNLGYLTTLILGRISYYTNLHFLFLGCITFGKMFQVCKSLVKPWKCFQHVVFASVLLTNFTFGNTLGLNITETRECYVNKTKRICWRL